MYAPSMCEVGESETSAGEVRRKNYRLRLKEKRKLSGAAAAMVGKNTNRGQSKGHPVFIGEKHFYFAIVKGLWSSNVVF